MAKKRTPTIVESNKTCPCLAIIPEAVPNTLGNELPNHCLTEGLNTIKHNTRTIGGFFIFFIQVFSVSSLESYSISKIVEYQDQVPCPSYHLRHSLA